MILPPRGTPVDSDRRVEIRNALQPEEVQGRIKQLMTVGRMRLA